MFIFRREVYLDNNATTRPSKRVIKRVTQVLRDCYGNPSSLYRAARDSAAVLEDSRSAVAAAVGANPTEIIFTGGASEGLNTILKTAWELYPQKKIIISPIEHSAVAETARWLASKGAKVEVCAVDGKGFLVLDALKRLLGGDTSLVCCLLANNETGVIQDIGAIAELAHSAGALLLSDCVQALGKMPVDVAALGVDYAVFSAHKIHGPKGVGAIYVKTGSPLLPLIHGGHQEGGQRAGTESVHNIAGFAEACGELPELLAAAGRLREAKMRLLAGLRALKPDLKVNTPEEGCLPGTLSVVLPGVANSVLMGAMDFYGLSFSAGSACNTKENAPSHVLKAIGLSDEEARSTIRLSLPADIMPGQVEYALRAFSDYFTGRCPGVTVFTPGQIGENELGGGIFILDVRFAGDRRAIRGLPRSREVPFWTFTRHVGKVPKDKPVLVICQDGFNAPLVAFYLRNKGWRDVGFLAGGLRAWKFLNPELYEKHCGRDIAAI